MIFPIVFVYFRDEHKELCEMFTGQQKHKSKAASYHKTKYNFCVCVCVYEGNCVLWVSMEIKILSNGFCKIISYL